MKKGKPVVNFCPKLEKLLIFAVWQGGVGAEFVFSLYIRIYIYTYIYVCYLCIIYLNTS